MRRARWTAALLFLGVVPVVAQTPAAPPAPSRAALLLGVGASGDLEDASTTFHTLLLVLEGNEMRLVREVDGLVVPRTDGFWRVGILPPQPLTRTEADSLLTLAFPDSAERAEQDPDTLAQGGLWYDLKLWAAPLGGDPVLPPREPDEGGDMLRFGGVRTLGISWVGNDYVSMEDYYETDGPMLNYVTAPMILPLDTIARAGYSGFLGGTAWTPAVPDDLLQRELDACVDDSDPESFTSRDMLETASQSWSIKRGRTRWVFVWGFNHGSGAARGYNADCATSVRPPAALVGRDALSVPWIEVVRHQPDAVTAFSAPGGGAVVVVTRDDLLAFHAAGRSLGHAFVGRARGIGGGRVVMAQWALGAHVDAWVQALDRAATLGLHASVRDTARP